MTDAPKFTLKAILLTTWNEPIAVKAWVHGHFAIHHRDGLIDDDEFVITHIPSGLSLCNVGGTFETMEAAERGVLAIESLTNWDFVWSERPEADLLDLRSRVKEALIGVGGEVSAGAGHNKDSGRVNGFERGAA